VRLFNPGNRVVLGKSSLATVTITDDDTILAPFRRMDGSITVIRAVGGKRWIVAGDFTDVDGYRRNGLARLETDGVLDPTFDAGGGADGPINAIVEQSDGKLLIGGNFGQFGGTTQRAVARIMADGVVDSSFTSGILISTSLLQVVTQPDQRILVSGSGLSVAGSTNVGLVRLNADGSPDASFTPATLTNVEIIQLQSDGRILVAGPFAGLLARVNLDGSLDKTFVPQLPTSQTSAIGAVLALAPLPDGRILVGGSAYFTEKDLALVVLDTNGQPASTQVRLSAPKLLPPGLASVVDGWVVAISAQPDGRLLLSGSWQVVNGLSTYGESGLLRLNADLTQDLTFAWSYGALRSMTIQADGTIGGVGYAAFPHTASVGVGRIAVLQTDGELLQDLRIAGVARLPDGQIHFALRGYAPSAGVMQVSADLLHWETLTNSSSQVQGMVFKETTVSNAAQRFYRALTQ
jgi:uncharacterized delta-60 repeat protein